MPRTKKSTPVSPVIDDRTSAVSESIVDTSRRMDTNINTWNASYIVSRYSIANDDIIFVPEEQRLWAWNGSAGLEKMRTLIDSVMHGYPVPAIIVNSVKDGGRERYALSDGRHRVETLKRFVSNEFMVNGRYYRDLSSEDQGAFNRAQFVVAVVNNATQTQLADVFERLNAGVTLKSYDYCHNRRHTPLMLAVDRLILNNERLKSVFGESVMKRPMLANWAGLVLGLSLRDCGLMTTSWSRLNEYKDQPVNETNVLSGLDSIATLFERANNTTPRPSKTDCASYAKIGNVIAYFSHEILQSPGDATMNKWVDIITRKRSGDPAVSGGMKSALKCSGAQNLNAARIAEVLAKVDKYLDDGVASVYTADDEDEE